MNHLTDVRKFDRVLYEEDWDVVSDNIPIAFFGIELHGKATDVSNCISTATTALNGREPYEYWSLSRGVRQHRCKSEVRCAFEKSEFAESTCSAGMNHTLGNTLMIKAMNLEAGLFDGNVDKAAALAFSLAC